MNALLVFFCDCLSFLDEAQDLFIFFFPVFRACCRFIVFFPTIFLEIARCCQRAFVVFVAASGVFMFTRCCRFVFTGFVTVLDICLFPCCSCCLNVILFVLSSFCRRAIDVYASC